ncbi:MAG: DUF1360 domain-containing protein [Saprospiraceae bacterium]|nr:DUF1360 domain-containing protein [Saprospiraceae bacterium]
MDWFEFLLASLAVWRITHLLSQEDGPFDLVFRLRQGLGQSVAGKLMDCFYCLSVWIALFFALALGSGWKNTLLLWWALSGLACLLERATERTAPGATYFEE